MKSYALAQVNIIDHPLHGYYYVIDAEDGEPQTEPKPTAEEAWDDLYEMHPELRAIPGLNG